MNLPTVWPALSYTSKSLSGILDVENKRKRPISLLCYATRGMTSIFRSWKDPPFKKVFGKNGVSIFSLKLLFPKTD